MRTVIIIPCYNEAGRIDGKAFLEFARQHADIHFLFVNDGSSDATAEMLAGIVGQLPQTMSALHLAKNSGKAEAVRQGFLQAFTSAPDVIGFLDADLAAPLSSIVEMATAMAMERKDIVMAARVALLGRTIERNPARHYAGRVFATAASMILGLRVYDTQCGAKLFRVNERLRQVFARPFTVKWIFDVEILARFLVTERSGEPKVRNICLEYPLREWIDKKGSKVSLLDFLASGLDLVKIIGVMRKKALS